MQFPWALHLLWSSSLSLSLSVRTDMSAGTSKTSSSWSVVISLLHDDTPGSSHAQLGPPFLLLCPPPNLHHSIPSFVSTH